MFRSTFLKLGRWCHPTSAAYKHCDQGLKATLANYDNGFSVLPKKTPERPKQPTTRDPISVLFANMYGM